MAQSRTATVTLEEVKVRFEEWRRTRQGRAKIPAALWASAVEVGRREGVSRTSTELRLGWSDLKQRITAAGTVSRQPVRPDFVELIAPQAQAAPECTIELEGRRGKLRIELKNASAAYVAALSREFWEAAS